MLQEPLERAFKRYKNEVKLVLYPVVGNDRSELAVHLALCAGEQNKFWDMHKMLYKHQSNLNKAPKPLDTLLKYSGELGLDTDALKQCVHSGKMKSLIKADQDYGRELRVSRTPTLFVNNHRIVGAQSEEEIVRTIRQELARVRRTEQSG